jgi:hypothetical protein
LTCPDLQPFRQKCPTIISAGNFQLFLSNLEFKISPESFREKVGHRDWPTVHLHKHIVPKDEIFYYVTFNNKSKKMSDIKAPNSYRHNGWVGEPYKSDFDSMWGMIKLSDMVACSDCPTLSQARRKTKLAGSRYFIWDRESKRGCRLYKIEGPRCACVYAALEYQFENAKRGRQRYQKLDERVKQVVRCAKARAEKSGIPFMLDTQNIIERVQNGICEATGLPFDLNWKEDSSKCRSPFAPSLDQIVPRAGYTTDNVQIVCWGYNLMKSNFDKETFQTFVAGLVKTGQLTI